MGGLLGRSIAVRLLWRLPVWLAISAGVVLLCAVPSFAARSVGADDIIRLDVDVTDVIHGIAHVNVTMPAKPGKFSFAYPRWIPGEHEPNGAIEQVMRLRVHAGNTVLSWRRDLRELFTFHVVVPPDVNEINIEFDYYSPPVAFGNGFAKSPGITPRLIMLPFNQVLMYPTAGSPLTRGIVAAVTLPKGWTAENALQTELGPEGNWMIGPTTLAKLVDAPLLASPDLQTYPISTLPELTQLVVASEGPTSAPPLGLREKLNRLVIETRRVFGPGHFNRYTWLLALSEEFRHDGTEHSESSDIRQAPQLFSDPDQKIEWVLFAHEFVHSWNGKFRRPEGLLTRDFQSSMNDELLWVYEGLTRYYADLVLTARSGIWSPDLSRDYLAYVAAQMADDRPGRSWRALVDTAIAVPDYSDAPIGWTAERRGSDYYNEMLLVWLEADMMIRLGSGGQRSLDDFAREFFDGGFGKVDVRPYKRADVVKALASVLPVDWNGFFDQRVYSIAPAAPLRGLETSGWRLVRRDESNAFAAMVERLSSVQNLSASLGAWVSFAGVVEDVLPGSLFFDAGIVPGVHLRLVAGHKWSPGAACKAIIAAEKGLPINITFDRGGRTQTVSLQYSGGLRTPHLERELARRDELALILATDVEVSANRPTRRHN